MSETTGNKTTGRSGDPNTTPSNNKTGSGTGSGTTNSGKQSEKVSESNLVTQEKPKTVEVEIKTENKADQKTTPKRKAPRENPTPKQKSNTDQVKDIQNLLEGVFMIASLKAGEHWTLSADESKQIAVPLSRILDRYDLLGKASEVSDPVALVVAVATITVPRVMLSKMSLEQKKAETLTKNGVMKVDQKRNTDGNSGSNGSPAKTTNPTNDGQFIKSLHTEIQEWFFWWTSWTDSPAIERGGD